MEKQEIQIPEFMKEKHYIDRTKKDEIKVVSFMNTNNYRNINTIPEIIKRLENPNLSRLERRELETKLKNLQIRNTKDLDGKKKIIQDKKQQKKNIKLTAKKIVIYAGLVSMITAGTVKGIKMYHDYQEHKEAVEFVKENYDVEYKIHEIKEGETFTSIAEDVHETLPEPVQEAYSSKKIANDMAEKNRIRNRDAIYYGDSLYVPEYVLKEEVDQSKTY